ncbi:hypothetical protein ABPG75_008042 [Micractinium tetrahymenae]
MEVDAQAEGSHQQQQEQLQRRHQQQQQERGLQAEEGERQGLLAGVQPEPLWGPRGAEAAQAEPIDLTAEPREEAEQEEEQQPRGNEAGPVSRQAAVSARAGGQEDGEETESHGGPRPQQVQRCSSSRRPAATRRASEEAGSVLRGLAEAARHSQRVQHADKGDEVGPSSSGRGRGRRQPTRPASQRAQQRQHVLQEHRKGKEEEQGEEDEEEEEEEEGEEREDEEYQPEAEEEQEGEEEMEEADADEEAPRWRERAAPSARQLRSRTIAVRQQRQAAEEEEDRQLPAPRRQGPARGRRQPQAAPQPGGRAAAGAAAAAAAEQCDGAVAAAAAAAAGDDDELVVDDLGPEAPRGLYARDWQGSCWAGLREIFSLMSVDQLRDFVEEKMDDGLLGDDAKWCLEAKKKGEVDPVPLVSSKRIAQRHSNFVMTGTVDGKVDSNDDDAPAGLNKHDVKQLLRDPKCEAFVERYVQQKLMPRYQDLPEAETLHALMWDLWNVPVGLRERIPEVPLGRRTIRYSHLMPGVLHPGERCRLRWRDFHRAYEDKQFEFDELPEELKEWIYQVNNLARNPKCSVATRINMDRHEVVVRLWQVFAPNERSNSQLTGTWKERLEQDDKVVAVDMHYVLMGCDGVDGSEFGRKMDALAEEHGKAAAQVADLSLQSELTADMTLKQFDKVMSRVEDMDRPEPEGWREQTAQAGGLLLNLRPYQWRTLAHMLREEQAEGGSARHLWVKFDLPKNPNLTCYVSPILHQIRTSCSRIEAEQMVNATGGTGWNAMQMGMGKTACAVAVAVLNKPPDGWRRNRVFQTLRKADYLASQVNNMPHGGTLVVMPGALLDQWEVEIGKTTSVPLKVLKYVDSKCLTDDCKEIASYDIVLTTFKVASDHPTLSSIRWWRIIVDEPQLHGSGAFLLDSLPHRWLAQPRWLLTGTPVNQAVDTISPSTTFLKLGAWDALYKYFPALSLYVLQHFMVRYTLKGRVDGVVNLQLPGVTENWLEVDMERDEGNDETGETDWAMYCKLAREQRQKFGGMCDKIRLDVHAWNHD